MGRSTVRDPCRAANLLNLPDTAQARRQCRVVHRLAKRRRRWKIVRILSFWSPAGVRLENRQHLNYNVARGEQLLLDTYRAVAEGPTGPTTLVIVIYNAAASTWSPGHRYPDDGIGEYGFDFTRFGPPPADPSWSAR
jgi:phospholipase C